MNKSLIICGLATFLTVSFVQAQTATKHKSHAVAATPVQKAANDLVKQDRANVKQAKAKLHTDRKAQLGEKIADENSQIEAAKADLAKAKAQRDADKATKNTTAVKADRKRILNDKMDIVKHKTKKTVDAVEKKL